MKKWMLFLSLAAGTSALSANDNVCTKCNKIREWHKKNPNPYVYYEDWLENGEKEEENPYLQKDDATSNIDFEKDSEPKKG